MGNKTAVRVYRYGYMGNRAAGRLRKRLVDSERLLDKKRFGHWVSKRNGAYIIEMNGRGLLGEGRCVNYYSLNSKGNGEFRIIFN